MVNFTCTAKDGIPNGSIEWVLIMKNGISEILIENITDDRVKENLMSTLLYSPVKIHQGANIYCNASQPTYDVIAKQSAPYTLNILCKCYLSHHYIMHI